MKEIILFLCIFLLIFILLLEIENTGPVFEARGVVAEKRLVVINKPFQIQSLQVWTFRLKTERESYWIQVDETDFERLDEGAVVFIKFRKSRIFGTLFAIEVRPGSH